MLQVELPRIGPYTPVRSLGEGSTVHTYLYRHEQRKKYAVIKFTRAPLITLEEKEAFLNRTKLLKKLKHRYIAEVVEASFHSMGEPADDYGYVILQYIEGSTIDKRFKAGQCYPPDEVRRVLLSLADTLQYAHKMFATHGNLHPGNVLQTEKDFFLTDFSLPVSAGEQAERALLYRAPEQLRDKNVAPTPASDQYALAVMAYEWLCGRRPYLATDPRELLSQQMGGPIPAPNSFNAQISPLVEKVLLQALAVNPQERFPQTLAFADTYLRALMGLSPASQASLSLAPAPVPQPQPSSSPTPASDVKVAQPAPARKKKSAARQAAASLEVPTATETPAALKLVATEHSSAPVQAVGGTAPALATQVQPEAAATPVRERSSQATFALVRERVDSEPKATPDRSSFLSEPGDLQRRVEADLRQGGVLSRALPGYEERPAQIEMAALVARSISDNTPAIIEASTGTGKALDVDTPIPTPTGWKRMGDLKPGDLVFDEQGEPTYVTAAFDVMYNRPCYEVAFSDGSSLIADAEHEWASYTALDRLRLQGAHSEAYEACSVPARRDIPRQSNDSAREGKRAVSPTRVATLMAVAGGQAERSEQIAFGSIFERDFTGEVEPGSASQEYTLVTTEQMAATLTVASSQRPNHAIALAGALDLPDVDLPIAPYTLGTWLGEQRFYSKHIPPIYLRTSARQRRALLAGLLDASGEIKREGAIEFTTASLQLVEDAYELLCSLGFCATLRTHTGHLGEEESPSAWTLAFTTDQPVFHLEQKAIAQKESMENVQDEHDCFRYVVAVHPVPTRPVRCIQVAAPSHLYLAGRAMIPTHNSLAYLISVVRSGKIAIVSTANKALQEQLFFKDIPFIQKYIRHIDAALVKGMGNYICLDRVEQERVGFQHYVRNRDFMRLLERIEESDERFTGDFETLGFTLPGDIRSKVSADRDQCTWSKCSYFADCYVHKMKSHAGQASVIVVNHTLLLLDAFMEGKLLPERDVIIVDEAHHLEEEATRAFTTTISQGQVATLLAQTMLKTHTPPALQEETKATMNLAWERLAQIADPGAKGRANLKEPLQEGLGLASMIDKLADALRTGRPKDLDEKDEQLYDKLLTRAQNLAADIRLVFSVNQPEKYVYYIERVQTGGRRGILQLEVSAAPLEVTNWLKEQLFEKSNVICTSATLATIGPDPARPEVKGPNFAYFRRRSGLDHESYPDVRERILPLTFDYEGHALLYLPRHIPEPVYGDGPAAQAYIRAIGREMMKLVEASRGRAFLLFSSKRMLDAVYEQFQAELPVHLKFPLLRQGDMTRIELVRSFREREGAVLFGLKSFWEGVDIAGEALSLVVIDKLPFDPPDDPVHEARVAQMKAAGENWFGTFVLPQTVLRLKQGLGRLLRTHDDRGVMAILDTRLYTKSYGKQIIQALPPARRAFNIETVIRFFQQPEDEDEAPF